MSLTQDVATEQYQLTCDQLMEIAENYNVSEEVSAIALATAQKLTLQFIDNKIANIKALGRQYEAFINTLETVIKNLEQTTIEQLLVEPLKERLQTAKQKSSKSVAQISWVARLKQFLQWLRTR